MFHHFYFKTLALFTCVIGVCTASAETAETFRVGMSGQYMPLHGATNSGKKVGFESDLAYLLGKHLGKKVVFLSRSDLKMGTLQAVAEGKVDIGLSAITPTADRWEIVDFSKPIAAVPFLIVHDGSAKPCEKEVLAASGPTYAAANKALGDIAKPVKNNLTALQLIRAGKARCAVVEEPFVESYMNKYRSSLQVHDIPVGESPIAIAVAKGKQREIDALLEENSISGSMQQFRSKWGVRLEFDTTEPLILPYAKWPETIRTTWTPSPDFGSQYLAQLREAHQAKKLFPTVKDLIKQADAKTTKEVANALVVLAEDYPSLLGMLETTKLVDKMNVEGKKRLVRMLHTYLRKPKQKRSFGELGSITNIILSTEATPYVELSELLTSLCKQQGFDSESFNRGSNPTLLAAVFKQTRIGTLRRSLYDYYNTRCSGWGPDGGAENESRPGYISWYEHPITYALAMSKDTQFTEELLQRLLLDILVAEGDGASDMFFLMMAETIAMYKTELTDKLEPLIVEAKALVIKEYHGNRDNVRYEYRARAAAGKAQLSAQETDAYAWEKVREYKTRYLEPKIYDRRDSTDLAKLPTAIRNYLQKHHPPDPPGTGKNQYGMEQYNKDYRYRLDVWDQYAEKILFFSIYRLGCSRLSERHGGCRLSFYYDPVSNNVANYDLKSQNMTSFCQAGQWPSWVLRGILDLNKDGNPEALFQCADDDGLGGGYSYQEWKDGKFTARKLPE